MDSLVHQCQQVSELESVRVTRDTCSGLPLAQPAHNRPYPLPSSADCRHSFVRPQTVQITSLFYHTIIHCNAFLSFTFFFYKHLLLLLLLDHNHHIRSSVHGKSIIIIPIPSRNPNNCCCCSESISPVG